MGRFDYYKSGDWNAECDVCGQKYKASKLKLRWDGLRVCPKDFEFRHPQDFVRGIRDSQNTPFSRPEPPNVFVACLTCDIQCFAGIAIAGCALAGQQSVNPTFCV